MRVEPSSCGGRPERWAQKITLNDLDILELAQVLPGCVDRNAEVECDDLSRAVRGREVRVPAGAATGVEDTFALEELRLQRVDPVEELRFELRMHLREVLPLPSEGRRGSLLDGG